jgi:tetratricopeptide (TPR) repeat protein
MTVNELYDKIYTDDTTSDPKVFLGFLESNREIVENVTINGNQDLHDKVMRLTADYAHYLTMNENYKKAIPIIDKAVELFQTYSDFKDTDLYKIGFYETLIFDRAIANYYLQNFEYAKQDLKALTDKFPDNDKYKNWLATTKTYSIQKLINVLWYVIAAVVLLTSFTGREDIGVLYDIILILGGLVLIGAISAEIFKATTKKKIKNGG